MLFLKSFPLSRHCIVGTFYIYSRNYKKTGDSWGSQGHLSESLQKHALLRSAEIVACRHFEDLNKLFWPGGAQQPEGASEIHHSIWRTSTADRSFRRPTRVDKCSSHMKELGGPTGALVTHFFIQRSSVNRWEHRRVLHPPGGVFWNSMCIGEPFPHLEELRWVCKTPSNIVRP